MEEEAFPTSCAPLVSLAWKTNGACGLPGATWDHLLCKVEPSHASCFVSKCAHGGSSSVLLRFGFGLCVQRCEQFGLSVWTVSLSKGYLCVSV